MLFSFYCFYSHFVGFVLILVLFISCFCIVITFVTVFIPLCVIVFVIPVSCQLRRNFIPLLVEDLGSFNMTTVNLCVLGAPVYKTHPYFWDLFFFCRLCRQQARWRLISQFKTYFTRRSWSSRFVLVNSSQIIVPMWVLNPIWFMFIIFFAKIAAKNMFQEPTKEEKKTKNRRWREGNSNNVGFKSYLINVYLYLFIGKDCDKECV